MKQVSVSGQSNEGISFALLCRTDEHQRRDALLAPSAYWRIHAGQLLASSVIVQSTGAPVGMGAQPASVAKEIKAARVVRNVSRMVFSFCLEEHGWEGFFERFSAGAEVEVAVLIPVASSLRGEVQLQGEMETVAVAVEERQLNDHHTPPEYHP